MVIYLEAKAFAASPAGKMGEGLKNMPLTSPPKTSPFVGALKVQNIQPFPKESRVGPMVQGPLPTAPLVAPKVETPKTEAPKADTTKFATSVDKALYQLETSYDALRKSINLKKFDGAKIEDYLRLAEKRSGAPIPDEEKAQLREMAKSPDPEMQKLVALELHVGVSEKAEKDAMAALGRLILHRDQTKALQAYLLLPDKDPNLKAYVRTVLMMNRVEGMMRSYETVKRKVKRVVSPFSMLFPPISNNN